MNELYSGKNAFIFQGVGIKYQKFLTLLDESQRELLKEYCSIVYKKIKLDLWGYLTRSLSGEYDDKFSDWVSIYTIDCVVYNTYIEDGIKPSVLLGYSMGLITALACGKAISFEEGLELLSMSYNYPKYTSRKDEGMGLVTGMTCSDIKKIIDKNELGDYAYIASENNEYCILVSGMKNRVDKLLSIALTEGALSAKDIDSPYAFHSKYALIGIEEYEKLVSRLCVCNLKIPIISSYDQRIIVDSCELKKELVKNVWGEMKWMASVEKAININNYNFFEVSLIDSISRFSRMINSNCKFFTYKSFMKIKNVQVQN
ncbi:malonyl CoA-acyl carrier protein transacylase [Clostridium acetobutylicum]|nr:malonyl CoA-acyl carrier protein transacylase [Clostridium acetobutylicum]NOW12766.1 malonyl CoA-acyl carrier protein transacylase [Clostridium acetobutylicum]NRY55142.1 malonyl CoA-acyl carrier protein transacylase [Clostridium acetobutylicum]NSA93011.1 malonyl CoA-acyl carrier protein transacylase [Clostridium acetobutylicum]NYC94063.1 malonyl CoA-acyl carrier protein transacylase [Clostridium acetobutylicum]